MKSITTISLDPDILIALRQHPEFKLSPFINYFLMHKFSKNNTLTDIELADIIFNIMSRRKTCVQPKQ